MFHFAVHLVYLFYARVPFITEVYEFSLLPFLFTEYYEYWKLKILVLNCVSIYIVYMYVSTYSYLFEVFCFFLLFSGFLCQAYMDGIVESTRRSTIHG